MNRYLKPNFLAGLLGLWLLLSAMGCTLFHPYRMPTPKTPPDVVARQKAAKKAKKEAAKNKGKKEVKAGESPDEKKPDDPPATDEDADKDKDKDDKPKLPSKSGVKYDKHDLMKKPKLMRRRLHKPAKKPFRPFAIFSGLFKSKPHGKPKSKDAKAPAPPSDDAP